MSGAPRVYIAGPMTGIEDFNRPAFNEYAERLRMHGYNVVNPADLDKSDSGRLLWEDYMRRDIPLLLSCDQIHLLKGWRDSKGAVLESQIASALRMVVVDTETRQTYYSGNLPVNKDVAEEQNKESILEEAKRLVLGDRGKAYGPPSKDFERVAALWSPIIGATVKAEQIPLCMVALKISRQCNSPKRDNWTDMAGYAQCGAMVDEEAGRI